MLLKKSRRNNQTKAGNLMGINLKKKNNISNR